MRSPHIRSLVALAATLGACAASASNWDPVVTLKGKSIELDRSRVGQLADGRATAWSRLALDRELIDETGMRYTAVEALNRYDCEKHSFATLKRIYRRDGKTVRTEAVGTLRELAAEPGSSDDVLLTTICKSAIGQKSAEIGAPVVDAKPKAIYADVRNAADGPAASGKATAAADGKPAAKAADKTEAKPGDRNRFIELPKIDKSKVEDPNAVAKGAETKDTKAEKGAAKSEKASPKTEKTERMEPSAHAAEPRAGEKSGASRAELERQYATSGPRRAKPKKAEPLEPAVVEHREIHWSYEGEGSPANWSKLRPDFATCGAGRRQSPIDIRDSIKVDLEPIKFDYKPSHFSVIDNGHTIQVTVGEGNSIQVMERSFQLIQFHFHKPSEERINGRAFDMVVHLVHRDETTGQLGVLAVLLERGSEHPLIQTIWNHMPLEREQEVLPSSLIEPALLLPPPDKRAYYTYMGSLTTPPCTEDVLWMVFRQPVQVSPQQIGIFSKLYPNNARPVQPSNGRLVKENR